MKWKKALPPSHQRNLIKEYPELPTDVARGEKTPRNKNCEVNHLPNSAGNVTSDYLEVLGSFQAGKTSSFDLRFQPGFELTALHRRSKALNHTHSHNCSAWLCSLQFILHSAAPLGWEQIWLCAGGTLGCAGIRAGSAHTDQG